MYDGQHNNSYYLRKILKTKRKLACNFKAAILYIFPFLSPPLYALFPFLQSNWRHCCLQSTRFHLHIQCVRVVHARTLICIAKCIPIVASAVVHFEKSKDWLLQQDLGIQYSGVVRMFNLKFMISSCSDGNVKRYLTLRHSCFTRLNRVLNVRRMDAFNSASGSRILSIWL